MNYSLPMSCWDEPGVPPAEIRPFEIRHEPHEDPSGERAPLLAKPTVTMISAGFVAVSGPSLPNNVRVWLPKGIMQVGRD